MEVLMTAVSWKRDFKVEAYGSLLAAAEAYQNALAEQHMTVASDDFECKFHRVRPNTKVRMKSLRDRFRGGILEACLVKPLPPRSQRLAETFRVNLT